MNKKQIITVAVLLISLVVLGGLAYFLLSAGLLGKVLPTERYGEQPSGKAIPVNQQGKSVWFEHDSLNLDTSPVSYCPPSIDSRYCPSISGKVVWLDDKLLSREGGGYTVFNGNICGSDERGCANTCKPLFTDEWFGDQGIFWEGTAKNDLDAGFHYLEWMVGCASYNGNCAGREYKPSIVCDVGSQRIFVNPLPCTLADGEFLVLETFDSGEIVSTSRLMFEVSKFCSAHPAIIYDKRTRLIYTDYGVTKAIRDSVYPVPEYQQIFLFYVTNIHHAGKTGVPCESNQAIDLADDKCKDAVGFIKPPCKGNYDEESGICYEQFQTMPECPRGSYWDGSTCMGEKVDCPAGEAFKEGDVWVCRITEERLPCDGEIIERDGGSVCVLPPEYGEFECEDGTSPYYSQKMKKWVCFDDVERTDENEGCPEGYTELGNSCIPEAAYCNEPITKKCPDGTEITVADCVENLYRRTDASCGAEPSPTVGGGSLFLSIGGVIIVLIIIGFIIYFKRNFGGRT